MVIIMDSMGIASLMERREGKIGGKSYYYYTDLGVVIVYQNASWGSFQLLSGKYFGKKINKHTRYEELMVTNFIPFNDLNNLVTEAKINKITKIMGSLKKDEGKYYSYDYEEDEFKPINDEDIVKQIKENDQEKLSLHLK